MKGKIRKTLSWNFFKPPSASNSSDQTLSNSENSKLENNWITNFGLEKVSYYSISLLTPELKKGVL